MSTVGKKFVFGLLLISTILTLAIGNVSPAMAQPAPEKQAIVDQQAKYVFLFIGDGMGIAQRDAAELYKAALAESKTGTWHETRLLMNTFPAQGMTTTYDSGSIITDSASAGTAIATGNKTLSGVISMSPDKTEKYPTIAEIAHAQGWKVGIVTSVSLDHATPAVFYAHNSSRKNMYDLEEQLVRSKFDYFAGGGFVQPTGSKKDKSDNYVFAQQAGYTITRTKADFEKLSAADGKIIAINPNLDADMAMPFVLDMVDDDISLAEFTRKGIEVLDNETGFFMMVEGGKIDWSAHANDALSTITDTLEFDAALSEAYAFYEKHPDETVIIVTGDHETGGMSIGFAGTQYATFMDKISQQKVSYVGFDNLLDAFRAEKPNGKFTDILPAITDNFGLLALTKQEMKDAQAAVAAAALPEATEEQKAAALETSAKLSMALSDDELEVLKDAFKETMLPVEKRDTTNAGYLAYGNYEPLTIKITTILNNKAGIAWTTYSHTGSPVQTSAVGVGADLFNGYYDNTDIFDKMMQISGLPQK